MAPAGMRITALVAALIATAVLTACGESSPPASDAQSTEHNAADVTFAQKMIPHHQQALDMAAMVPSRTTNEKLIVMAKHIALDQQAQIETLQGLPSSGANRLPRTIWDMTGWAWTAWSTRPQWTSCRP